MPGKSREYLLTTPVPTVRTACREINEKNTKPSKPYLAGKSPSAGDSRLRPRLAVLIKCPLNFSLRSQACARESEGKRFCQTGVAMRPRREPSNARGIRPQAAGAQAGLNFPNKTTSVRWESLESTCRTGKPVVHGECSRTAGSSVWRPLPQEKALSVRRGSLTSTRSSGWPNFPQEKRPPSMCWGYAREYS